MLSTINLLSDQPGTTRICSGKYGMQGNNKIKWLLIIAVTPFGHSGEIFLNAEIETHCTETKTYENLEQGKLLSN